MVGFTLSCVGILLFLWLSFGGTIPLRPEAYRFTAAFPEASTLVEEADVRLAGVNVGKVKTRELAKDGGRSVVEIELTEAYAPIPRDTKAILRQKTLLGETYVELTPGDPEAGMLGDGERLPRSNVKLTVELDEIYRIFDESTRKDFRGWVKEGSVAVAGDYAEDLNDAIGNLAPFATDGARPLVNDRKGPADDLGPTVRDLGDLAPDLQQLYRDLDPLIVAGNRGLPQGERFLRGSQPVFTALHNFLPELNPILAYLSFSRQQVAQFITVGGAALAGNGTGGYQAPRGAEHWLPQIALIDGQSFSRNTSRPSTDRGNAYVQPNAYQRSITPS